MVNGIVRPRAASAYAWLIALAAVTVIAQALLFGGFYWEGGEWIRAHLQLGRISTSLVVAVITPLAFFAGFPRQSHIARMTVVLAMLWLLQTGLGDATNSARWLVVIHVPLVFVIFGLAVLLTSKAHRALKGYGPAAFDGGEGAQ